MTKIEETSLSIVNKAFANEFTEPTCQLIPQRNANLKDQIQIKPVIAPMIPTPVNESYPTCFILAWLIPLIIVIAVVLIFLQYESWSIIPFALAIMIVIGLIYQVKSKYRGRQEFLAWVKCCCLCCDFRSNLKLATTIRRYEEDLTLSKEEVTQVVFQHPFLVAFMDELCMKMPEFYFSFLISGSLRERFGKMLPSKSVLGTDFDIMLLPDGAVAAYPNQHKESPLFLIEDKGTSDGFVWLKLNNHFLTQWDKLCLKKHIDNGSSYLSSHYLTKSVEEVIKNSSDIRTNIKKRLGFNNEDIKITAGVQGPALKVEVEVKNKPLCYSDNKPIKLFEADFTLAIQCPYWPDVAKDFFENANRRINWPDPSVIKEIKKYGCHLTPKQSTDALVKIESNQSENTTFGKTQFLE